MLLKQSQNAGEYVHVMEILYNGINVSTYIGVYNTTTGLNDTILVQYITLRKHIHVHEYTLYITKM